MMSPFFIKKCKKAIKMENGITKISVYGDSILKGAVTGTDSGNLFDVLDENGLSLAAKSLGFELNNQSVFGNIVTKGKRKLSREIERGVVFDCAIIESGGNDCDYDWNIVCESPFEFHNPRVSLEDFIKTIDEMVNICRQNKITPLLMTMPPLVEDWWFTHLCESFNEQGVREFTKNIPSVLYQNHEIYNFAILDYCRVHNVQFVDMRFEILKTGHYRDLMCRDGIHPNWEGHKFMATVWEKELPKVKKE